MLPTKRIARVAKFPELLANNKSKSGPEDKDGSGSPKKQAKVLAGGSLTNPGPCFLPKSLLKITKAMKFSETLTPRSMELRGPSNSSGKRKNLNEADMFSEVMMEAERERLTSGGPVAKKEKPSISILDIQESLQDVEDERNPTPETFVRPSGLHMDWDEFLKDGRNLWRIPPVHLFKNAPFANIWKKIAVPNLAIELRNPFVENEGDAFWIGKIIHFAGYRGLVQFETMGTDSPEGNNYLTWISFCSEVPKPLGWCGRNNKELMPGPIVSNDIPVDMFQQKLSEFYRSPTIADAHYKDLLQELEKMKRVNHKIPVEALDLDCFQANRLARISAVFGNRVHVEYYPKGSGKDFWFNYDSESLHPLGWSHTLGVQCNGFPPGVRGLPLPPETFPAWPSSEIKIKVGMRLETRHPFLMYKIVGALVTKVLTQGYFVIQTLDVELASREQFLYHVTSPFIFPVGFGARNGIAVEFGPHSVHKSGGGSLRLDLLPPRPDPGLRVGQKVEAIDPVDGWFIGAATVMKVADHLLYVHFDGWKEDLGRNYAWVDTAKSDIFPPGYCEMLGLDWRGHVAS